MSPPLAKCPFWNAAASLPETRQSRDRQRDAGKAARTSHHYVNTLRVHPSQAPLKATTVWPSYHSTGPRAEDGPSLRSADVSGAGATLQNHKLGPIVLPASGRWFYFIKTIASTMNSQEGSELRLLTHSIQPPLPSCCVSSGLRDTLSNVTSFLGFR